MRKLLLAACLAAPFVMLSAQSARAQWCEFVDMARWARNHYCSCWAAHHGYPPGHGGCGCGAGGHAGCGCGCHLGLPCGLLNPFGCDHYVPGPWYLYFPYDGQTQVMAGYGRNWPGGWNYEMHFQVAAPVGDWFTNMTPIAPAPPPDYSFQAMTGAAPLPAAPAPTEAAITAPPGVSTASDQ